ncbi:squalene/phytoene synthase family protein [Alphaproteobacteria bacterium GH1-50]|uniref:Squalene/phytoene synthase family protein n=1 Tax=Kangsaoukella pontilimi TaxID=2691042 RepID=A0A7C9MT01_9RHOB|nr:phytoene/squalene synthase family protein [Kangsaoukella pontilimi]MXQ09757.1 squalene/phytoene synthase family protein [Kangsaoukella pontilimi]
MINPRDLHICRDAIRQGSLSFYAASKLLPAKVRDPALALYAFCRLADDAVDLHDEKISAVLRLRDRLDAIYEGRPNDAAADRAFAAVVEMHEMPKALPDALLEGLAWDAQERRYRSLSGVIDYSARVAAAVGAMMSVLMGVRDADALARACDLGVAMQLTNIARDVGEDARAGRIYLPLDWLDAEHIAPEAFLADPVPDDRIRRLVQRLLREADRLYARSEAGIAALPLSVRPGIFAARHVYAGIGAAIAKNGHDTISYRARTYKSQKIGWLALATLRSGVTTVMPRSAVLHAQPLPECAFLVSAAARPVARGSAWGDGRSGALLSILADLEARDQSRKLDRLGA